MKLENSNCNLDYKIINLTSIEQNDLTNVIPFDKLPRLLRINGTPWTSERFCSYPQKIIIKFHHVVNISQINILSHSKKISRRLQFYYYYPDDIDKNKQYEYDEIPFKKLGFINLRDNKQCNYSVRELKKIFVKIQCLFIKIELENNYKNYFNKYQQVGISCIEFIGRYLGKYSNLNFLSNDEYDKNGLIKSNIKRILNEVCPDTYNNLNKYVNNKKNYNSGDYDEIKGKFDDIKNDAKKIYQVELLEKEASRDNDFDKAIEFKNKKEKGKYALKEKATEINKLFKNDFINNNLDLERSNANRRKINNNNNNNENGNENNLNNDENNINTSKKMTKSFSAPEINSQNENNSIKNLNQTIPLDELDEKQVKKFNSLINFINQDGLRNLLSPKIANKLEGIKTLNLKLDELFSSSGDELNNNILQLLDAIGLILEDKNTLFLKQISDLIEGTIKRISYDENMKNDPKIKTSLTKNIVNKLRENIGLGMEFKKQGKMDKAAELFQLILDKNILNFDNLVKSLLLDDINILNSNENPLNNINNSISNNNLQNNKIYSKLNIIKRILEDFDNKVDDNITTKETFPKEAVAEFILLNMNNKDNKIKKLINDSLKLYIDLFGFEDLQEKSLYYFKGQNELEKIANQFPALKPLFNKFLTNSEVNIFIPSQIKQKPKLIKNSFEINYLYRKYKGNNINDIDMNNIENKNKKIENICELCKMNIGEKSNEEHITECKMYTTCEACSEIIKVELLNNHRLELCINKNNYKQCDKCKEAIPNEIYNLHIEKNVCNPIKSDMSRCPFCHHDIEKEQEGFYQHLVIDGCAYQV